jgi:hypothetical protein
MARARNIKPAFFSNELLAELQAFDRLLFVGLWCLADREGRIEDRPKRIKMELFPCDSYDVDAGLTDLCAAGFVIRYQVGDTNVVEIVNFHKHQSPHGSEKDSILPDKDGYLTVNERAKNVVLTGKSKKVHVGESLVNVKPPLVNALIPDVLIPDCGILNPEEDQEPLPSVDDERAAKKICYSTIQQAYNETCSPALPACAVMNESRKRQIKAMASIEFMGKKPFTQGIEVWQQYFADCLTEPHWIGQNDRGWRADFDFVTTPKNAIKLMERMN